MRERVSVLICTYNYARYLRQCLKSVLNQTSPPDEIIVLDDGSTDGTPEMMKSFPEVRYIYQENTGKAVAFGRAFALTSGDIICHLDADDYWDLRKLERVLRLFAENSELGGVVHDVSYVDASGRAIEFPWASEHPSEPTMLTLDESADVGFLYALPKARGRFFGVPNTSSIRRSFLEDLLPLPIRVGGSVDGILVAAGLRYGMAYLPEALTANRIHGKNAAFGNVASTQETIYMWEFLLAHPDFRRFLSSRHASLLRAKIQERKAYLASRTGQRVLTGAFAGLRVPVLLAANGLRCSWKHLALPITCLLPVKRAGMTTTPEKEASFSQEVASSSPAAVQR